MENRDNRGCIEEGFPSACVMSYREQKEREVLATLILKPHAYKDLPEDFSSDAFEFPEYRDLYKKIDIEFISKSKPVDEKELCKKFPDLKKLIDKVLWGAAPSNGRLRAQAAALMNHRPPPEPTEETPANSWCGERKNNRNQFQFELLNGLEISQMEIPQQSYLVNNLISEYSVNMLGGEEGCGKSLVAMNLAISIAVGADTWLGYGIAKHGKVLYLNNELPFPTFGWRVKTMSNSLPAQGDISNLIAPRVVPVLSECWDSLNETCERENPCLIIVDALYFLHDRDENDSSEMKTLMRKILALRDIHNLAVLLIHHTKKGSRHVRMHNDQMRGSNVFGGITDTVLQMRRSGVDETKRIIKPTKFRHVGDEERKCRLLSLNPETLWFRDEGETNEDDHIARLEPTAEQTIDWKEIIQQGEVVSRKEMLERCSPHRYDERTIDRCLKKAKAAGTLKVPKFGYYSL